MKHSPIRHWYLNSGIIECGTCEGKGSYWNGQGLGGTDPDSWDIECPDSDQLGHHACEVCGFDVPIPGMDCLACDMVRELPAKLLTDEVADKLAAAVKASIKAAYVHAAQVAAETVEDDRRAHRWAA